MDINVKIYLKNERNKMERDEDYAEVVAEVINKVLS